MGDKDIATKNYIQQNDKFETDLKNVFNFIQNSDSKEKIKNMFNGKVRWMMRSNTVRFLNDTINAGLEVNAEGTLQTLLSLVKDNIIDMELAANRAHMSLEEFEQNYRIFVEG